MTHTKKTILAGAFVTLLLAGLIISQYPDYMEVRPRGALWFGLSLLLALLSGLAIALKPAVAKQGKDRSTDSADLGQTPVAGAAGPGSGSGASRAYTAWIWTLFFLAPLIAEAAVERMNGNFLWELSDPFFISDNYVVILLLYLLVFALTGSIRASILTVTPVLFLFGAGNMYVKAFKGSPLLPMDAGNVATAAKVAGGYNYSVGFELTFALCLTVFLMALAVHLAMPSKAFGRRREWRLRLTAFLVVALFAGLFYGTELPVRLDLRPDFFNQTRGYENRGAVLQFVYNTRYAYYPAPKGYDPEEIRDLVGARIDDAGEAGKNETVPTILEQNGIRLPKTGSAKAAEKPDIIVIMDESFADLSVLGDFKTNEPVMPNLTGLKKDTIRGDLAVSVRGTGTSNTEFEFLTGDTMAFLPAGCNAYQLYVGDAQPGLVTTLTEQGYVSEASHTYFRGNWNRPAVYEAMGFTRYIGMEDMFPEGFGEPYLTNGNDREAFARDIRETYPGQVVMIDGYLSDSFGYGKVIEAYEQRDKAKPYFHFHVTMQNHSPYQRLYSSGFESGLELTAPESELGPYRQAERYLQRIRESDRALGELIDYFRKSDRPVIVLFFGDHQPVLEEDFFAAVEGKPEDQLTDEELQRRYLVPFVLWANYDIPEGRIETISANYLSTLLLEAAGLAGAPYNDYLRALCADYPVITAQGCYDRSGRFFPAGGEAALEDYRKIVYNNVKDEAHRANDVFLLQKP